MVLKQPKESIFEGITYEIWCRISIFNIYCVFSFKKIKFVCCVLHILHSYTYAKVSFLRFRLQNMKNGTKKIFSNKPIWIFVGRAILKTHIHICIKLIILLTQSNSVWSCFPMNPERDPWENDYKNTGNINLNYEISGVPLKIKIYLKQREFACIKSFRTYLINNRKYNTFNIKLKCVNWRHIIA